MDVDYRDTGAVAAGLWFRGWSAAMAETEVVVAIAQVKEYEPGAFYRRELPCLLKVLEAGPRPDIILVDGYVWLGGKLGLGAHLHEAVGSIVVGVAKTRFEGATEAVEVLRGTSKVPLHVSAVGMTAQDAAARVQQMHGDHRVPTLLKRVDRLARDG